MFSSNQCSSQIKLGKGWTFNMGTNHIKARTCDCIDENDRSAQCRALYDKVKNDLGSAYNLGLIW